MTKKAVVCSIVYLMAIFLIVFTMRSVYADTTWNPVPIAGVNTGDEQTTTQIFDIDKDGLLDFIMTERTNTPSVVWYKRVGSSWQKYVIDATALRIEAGGDHYDIDGDGDEDVALGGDAQTNEIWWWENPYPNFDPNIPWNRYFIKASGGTKHHDSMFGDFDGDGIAEFVAWNQFSSLLLITEIPSDPKNGPWPFTTVDTLSGAEGLTKEDIDGDGIIDIVGGGAWYDYLSPGVFAKQIIDSTQISARVIAGQFIPGGYPEVVFSPGDGNGLLNFYQWNGTSWDKTVLLNGTTVIHGHSLRSGDINKDGHLDIFLGEMALTTTTPKMRLLYGNGAGGFQEQIISGTHDNHESRLGDLDGDGDLDILQKPYNTAQAPGANVWINTTTLSLDQWQRQVIDSAKPWRAIFITHGDLDGDGDKDIVTGGWWYRNPGTPSGSWTRQTIGSPLNNIAAVHDFDQDGDLDILGTQGQGSSTNNQFAWARNDGSGNFTILTNIETGGTGDYLQGVAVDRFSDGSPIEVALSWHNGGGGLQMLTVPADPSSSNWTWRVISDVTLSEQVSSGDIDRDGDKDLLLGTTWLRNDSGTWPAFLLSNSTGKPDRNRLADINKDGLLDAVVGYEAISVPGKLAWYEQPEVATDLWTEHIIAGNVIGPMSLDVADMNKDGRLDVITGEHNLATPTLANLHIFQNVDGSGDAWSSYTVYTGDEHHDGAQVVDIDNDGRLDIVSIGWGHGRVLLYENKNTLGTTIPPLVPTVNIAANPASISSGQSSTLTWSSTNATSCTASGAWSGTRATSGSATVSPTATSTYTLTCTGTGGTATQSATVTVSALPLPTVTISANPAVISSGQSSTLTWSSTNATSCTASGAWSGTRATSGSEVVSPTATSTYTLACTGEGGTTTQSTTVTVSALPLPTVSISANPAVISSGQSSTLTWSSTSATSCTASGAWSGTRATSGSEVVSPTTTSTYTLACSGEGGTTTQNTTVTVSSSPASLAAYWRLDETSGVTAVDSSGLGNTGTLVNGPVWTTGQIGGALAFNGTNRYVNVNNSTSLNLTSNTVTLEAWIFANNVSGTPKMIVSKPVSATTHVRPYFSYGLSILADGRIQFALANTATSLIRAYSASSLSANTWYHVAGVYNGANMVVYVNGVPGTAVANTANVRSYNTPVRIGVNGGLGEPMNGRIDDVRIYSRALSQAEVVNDMNGGVPAPTVNISANPENISSGESSTLTWSSASATSCTASGAWSGTRATSGSEVVSPTATSTYTLACTGTGGTTTQSATVTVSTLPLPTVTISANPAAISSGESSTLTWSSTNATSCTASGAWSGDRQLSGSEAVSPTATSTYTLACTGTGGTTTQSATVTVSALPLPTVSISANPAAISSGESSTLTWSSANAASCTASGAWSGDRQLSGSEAVSPTATSTYTLACTGTGGTTTQSTTVTVSALPLPTVTISANPAAISSGESSTLTWGSTNATSCTASGAWSGDRQLSGSEAVSPTATSTYTLACTGTGGTTTQSATVTVSEPPLPTVTISANPAAISSGESSTLTWSSTNATSCTASGAWSGTRATSGSEAVSPTTTSTYTLACSGEGGTTTQNTTVTVSSSPASLAAYWRLDETSGVTAVDSSGLGNTGTLVNGPVWTTGQIGGALAFNGTNRYVNVNNSTSLNLTSNTVTLEAWIFANNVSGTPKMIVSKPVSATTHVRPYFSYGLSILTGGRIQFAVANGATSYLRALSAPSLAANTWYHVAGVYNGTNMVVYVNGVPGTAVANTANLRSYNTPVRIGVNGGLGERMNGRIDDVRIYSRALSGAEIINDMNGGISP